MAYVDPDDLKASLSINDTVFDDDLEAACNAASEGIDRLLGRSYDKDVADVTRRYTALDPRFLNIRDLAELTTLKTDEDGDGTFEVTWATTDYVLQPINAAEDDEPYTGIEVNRVSGTRSFPRHQGAVQIVGKWGWPAVPPQIVEAAATIAAQLFKRKREAPFGFVITSDAAIYIARHDPQLNFLFSGLKRPKVVET